MYGRPKRRPRGVRRSRRQPDYLETVYDGGLRREDLV